MDQPFQNRSVTALLSEDAQRRIIYALEQNLGEQHVPHRGSDVEAFIKRARDDWREAAELSNSPRAREVHQALDRLLDDYRLHADTGTPLSDPTPDPTARSLAQGGDGS